MNTEAYNDRILLEGMKFFGKTGYYSFEKERGQNFEIDLTLYFRALPAVTTDVLTDTVNYASVFACVRSIVENSRFDLIERLAGEIINRIFSDFSADAAEVVVRKPEAPIDGFFDAVAVHIFRERSEA